MKTKYIFYKDFWPYLMGWSIVASGCVPLLLAIGKGSPVIFSVIWLCAFLAAAIFWMRSYCEFTDEYLQVVTGPVIERFYYEKISGLKATQETMPRGMARAVRFALYYNRALRRYLNPMDQEGFLKLFSEKCPDAKVE